MDYFELFGVPRGVDLDVKALEDTYRRRSLEVHPDRTKPTSPQDARARLHAAQASASLNEAFKTLRDPVRRAFYLLKLLGFDLAALPQEFLHEILEQRESLEAARHAGRFDLAKLLADDMRRRHGSALESAQQALREGEVTKAASALAQVRYYERFLEEVDAFEAERT